MGKIKRKKHSLKWRMAYYLPFCMVLAIAGSALIGFYTNDLQVWYRQRHPDLHLSQDIFYEIQIAQNGGTYYPYSSNNKPGRPDLLSRVTVVPGTISYGEPMNSSNMKYYITFWIISYAQILLTPAWVIFCFMMTGYIFYNRELKKPINILLDASNQIAENQLDFTIPTVKNNELGMLCSAFEDMRSALYDNNQKMWRSLEERRRLNAAFSHDLRTPLTILKGYTEFLEEYVPDGKVSEDKLLSVLSMMNGQISRLEHYTQKMNSMQKLEDITPNIKAVNTKELFDMFNETGNLICGSRFQMNTGADTKVIHIDTELVIQVYENLISNAERYAESSVNVHCNISENLLTIKVVDDGCGFSEEALERAMQPFFRDDKEDKTHFGLGLYICRILCEKCGGNLTVDNYKNGGMVTATFFCKKIIEK